MSDKISKSKWLKDIKVICEKFRLDALRPQIAAVEEIVRDDGHLSVALLGGFKAGKSSFINSIIGKNILPVAVLPLTSVITYVKYGSIEKAEVKFIDGSVKSIPLNELADFITEERNPENKKCVAEVCAELPDLQDYGDLRFVDTPGLGSAYKHNTATSKSWLPRVGATFFVISADRPLSEGDILILKELDQHTSEIIILLSKVDLLSVKETDDVVKFIRDQIRQHLNKEVRIFPFSNRPGFESHRMILRDFLLHSLAGSRGERLSEIINHKFMSLLSKCRDYLDLALSLSVSEQTARQDLTRKLEQEKELLRTTKNEIRLIVSDLKSKFYEELLSGFLGQHSAVTHDLVDDLKRKIPQWKGNFEKTIQAFRDWAPAILTQRLETISEQYGIKSCERFLDTAMVSLSRITDAFQSRLSEGINQTLHIKFTGAKFEVQLEKPKEPNIDVGNVFMLSWGVIGFLIPMRVFRPLVNHHLFQRIPWEVEKNLYRLRAQWADSASHSIDQIAEQADAFMTNEIDTVEKMLGNAPNRREEIEGAISTLNGIKVSVNG